MLTSLVIFSLQANMTVYLPLCINTKFDGEEHITYTMVAFALSANVLAQVLFMPMYDQVDKTLGRKNAVMFAYAILILMSTMTAVLFYTPKRFWLEFYLLLVVCRIVSGYAEGQLMATTNTIIGSVTDL